VRADEFTKVTPALVDSSILADLVPTVDAARDLKTQLGLRRYIVRIVRVRWTGSQRGSGTATIESMTVLEPTPKVTDLSGITEILQPTGIDEQGGIVVGEISGRYTEDILRGLDASGHEPERNQQVFYEIEFVNGTAQKSDKRRFTLRGAPEYLPGRFQWTVKLERAQQDRNRATGDVEG
jgi:hypothetical protein